MGKVFQYKTNRTIPILSSDPMQVKASILFFSFLFFAMAVRAQTTANPFARIDSIAENLPSEESSTISMLGDYINQNFNSEIEKSRFIFSWIATHVRYDINCALGKNTHRQDAMTVFNMHEGVCDGYSNLFAELCKASGVGCVKIGGVCTKNNYANHAWNAVKISGTWNLLDVTWGAGGVTPDFQFVPQFTDRYFFMPATDFIGEHLPFDPMWQLLYVPVSKSDFYAGNTAANLLAPADTFHFIDTIDHFFSLDSLGRERDYFRRSYAFDPGNAYLKEGRITTLMNQSLGFLAKGDPFFTKYFELKQHAFDQPDIFVQSEVRVRTLLDTVSNWYALCKNTYSKIPSTTNSVNAGLVNKNLAVINQRLGYLKEEQVFVDAYFTASQASRMSVLKSHSLLLKLTP